MEEGDLAPGKRTAAALGGWIVFEDESGQSLRPPRSRTWARRGITPVIRVRGGGTGHVSVAGLVFGSNGAATDHGHAHWIPLTAWGEKPQAVRHLVIWVPRGLQTQEVRAVLGLRGMSGRRGRAENGYEVRGFPPVELLFQAAGRIEQVAPELCGPARRWRSLTPYLPVRHRKRESLEDYLTADVRTELGYRDLPPASVTPADPEPRLPDRWARDFRRYRMTENMSRSRPGLGLRLEFGEPVARPVLLGRLSHFGYGVFIPDEGQ